MKNTYKQIWIVLFALLLSLAMCSCTTPSSNSSEHIKVEPLKDYKVWEAMSVRISEATVISLSDVVFQGIVLDKSEYLADEKSNFYIGIIKYKITDLIYSIDDTIKIGEEISILTSYTSRRWTSDAIDQVVNKEYIIFAKIDDWNNENDPYSHFFDITKYVLPSASKYVATVTKDGVKFDGIFETLAQKANPSERDSYKSNIVGCYVMSKEDFAREILNLINERNKSKSETPEVTSTHELTPSPIATSTPIDTSAPTDTTTPIDTLAPTDTTVPVDTTMPTDTTAPVDTTMPTDTTAPVDTSAPIDTFAPA